MDTTDVPAPSAKWCEAMQQRLTLARKAQSAIFTHAKDGQLRRADLPKAAKRTPPGLLPCTYCYYQIQRFSRSAEDGMKFTPTWSGPYLIRSTVPGSTETSASFAAHVTRLRTSPHKTFGTVALESTTTDSVGVGRGFLQLDPTIFREIDKVLEVNDKVLEATSLTPSGSRGRR
jgi:hypothetical protein